MNTSTLQLHQNSAPIWLKVVSVIGVIWYAFGLLQFWLGYSMDTAAGVASGAITAPHAAAIDGTPFVVWLAFAVASTAGLVGAAMLFSRSAKAKTAFTISLIAAAIYYGWIYLLSGTGGDRPSEEIIIAAVVGGVTLAFFLLSRRVT